MSLWYASIGLRISTPISGCLRIVANSSSVSLPGLSSIDSGTPILPMSWNNPPLCSDSSSVAESPNSLPMLRAMLVTLKEWPEVQGDLASTALARARMVPRFRLFNSSMRRTFSSAIAIWSAICRARNRSSRTCSGFCLYPRVRIA
ncbi:MAG: hypothetical protein ACD_55C00145G0003 [uncultured bacterium]|nr:MAG: hypothetical protein ACD_55C00145G0003 [uncultured bacterium]